MATYKVMAWGRVLYEGPSKLAALRTYIRAARWPFSGASFFVDGVLTCPRHGEPLEPGFTDGGGGWHSEAGWPEWASHPQTAWRPRCWSCDPWGSFPGEWVPEEDEELAARRSARAASSIAGRLRRIAEAFNAAMRGEEESE